MTFSRVCSELVVDPRPESLQTPRSVFLPLNYIVPDSYFFHLFIPHEHCFFLLCLAFLCNRCGQSNKNPVHTIKNLTTWRRRLPALGQFVKCYNRRLHRLLQEQNGRASDTQWEGQRRLPERGETHSGSQKKQINNNSDHEDKAMG